MDQTSNTSNVATLASCFFISKKEEELVKHSTEEGSSTSQRLCVFLSWKTWKVVEFKHFIFQAWIVMEFNSRSLKVMEIEVLFDSLVTAGDKARTM